MKKLLLLVSRCFGCPYYRTPKDDKVKLDWCYPEGKLIESVSSIDIPEWCPLPDVEANDE